MSTPMSNVSKDDNMSSSMSTSGNNPSGSSPGLYASVPQTQPFGENYESQQPYDDGPQQPFGEPQQPSNGGPTQQLFEGRLCGGYTPEAGLRITQPGVPGGPLGQPMQPDGDWMSKPTGIPNGPLGLEILTETDKLLVKQQIEWIEVFTGFETNNKFIIKNALGQNVFYAVEDTDCCTRNMCGSMRPFDMKVFDESRNEVIHIYRPLACSVCCFPCCLQSMTVYAPPGKVIGSIQQEWSMFSQKFNIKNHKGKTMMRIEGPCWTCSVGQDIDFNLMSKKGERVGKISKQWSGLAREIFTDADFFGISFPLNVDVRMKAVLLGATFLIDAMFFEDSG